MTEKKSARLEAILIRLNEDKALLEKLLYRNETNAELIQFVIDKLAEEKEREG